MAEPHRKSGHFQVEVSYSFDRLLESKLAQAYEILVPCRERPVGAPVKEFENENGGDLREGVLRTNYISTESAIITGMLPNSGGIGPSILVVQTAENRRRNNLPS